MSLLKVGTGAAPAAIGNANNKMPTNCFIMLEPLFWRIDRAPESFRAGMRHGFALKHGVERFPQIEPGRLLAPNVKILYAIVDAPQVKQRPVGCKHRRRW